MSLLCPECNGIGGITVSEMEHGCGGDEELCAAGCPVQVMAQQECGFCNGSGECPTIPALQIIMENNND